MAGAHVRLGRELHRRSDRGGHRPVRVPLYAERLGVVPEPTIPLLTLVLVGLGASVLATVIAVPIAHRATRLAPGSALQSE